MFTPRRLHVATAAAIGLALAGCCSSDQPTTKAANPPALQLPASCNATLLTTSPTTIPCEGPPCGDMMQQYCPSQWSHHARFPRPDGKPADYLVYWGVTGKALPIDDPQNAGFCVIQADPGYGLVTGTAPVIYGRRVRAASDGTVFATEIDLARNVERVVVLYVAAPHFVEVTAAGQSKQSLDASNFTTHYLLFPLDGSPSKISKLSGTAPNDKAAYDFRCQMVKLACKVKAEATLRAAFPTAQILGPD